MEINRARGRGALAQLRARVSRRRVTRLPDERTDMKEPQITVHFDEPRRVHEPGETLCGECRLSDFDVAEVQALELSVLWYTEGKGDEDFAVHHFERRCVDDAEPWEIRHPLRFRTVLPNSPLSYEGTLLKIRWCVRARL